MSAPPPPAYSTATEDKSQYPTGPSPQHGYPPYQQPQPQQPYAGPSGQPMNPQQPYGPPPPQPQQYPPQPQPYPQPPGYSLGHLKHVVKVILRRPHRIIVETRDFRLYTVPWVPRVSTRSKNSNRLAVFAGRKRVTDRVIDTPCQWRNLELGGPWAKMQGQPSTLSLPLLLFVTLSLTPSPLHPPHLLRF